MIHLIFSNFLHYLSDAQSRAIGLIFMINALAFSTWAIRIPEIKTYLDISDGQLGLALLAAPLGVVSFAPLTTIGINRFGAGRMTILTTVYLAISLIWLGMPQSLLHLWIALFFFGMGNGALDISMNAVASAIEKQQNRVIMSTTHGFWSLGAMIFSLIAGIIAGLHIPYLIHFIGASIICLVLLMAVHKNIYAVIDHQEQHFRWTLPDKSLMILIVLAFIVFMSEGAVMDWNAIFYNDVLKVPAAQVGLGFTAFAGAMAIARFSGDAFIQKYSKDRVLLVAITMCVIGLFCYASGLGIWVCTSAMLFCGIGFSVLIPILFRQAAMTEGIAPSMALAMVSTLGYMGFLVGPPAIGFISEAYNLKYAFGAVGVLMLLALGLTWRVR